MEYSEWKKETWEVYYPQDLKKFLPTLSDDGIDLLKKLLELDPEKRILYDKKLKKTFFKNLNKKKKKMYE